MSLRAAMTSLAVQLPARVVTNDYFRGAYPDIVRTAEERALGKLWRPSPDSKSARFDAAMSKYLADPFRGCVERRWLAPGDKAIDLEEPAARQALAAAGLDVGDVDLLICSSFFPDQFDVGNASFLAKRLGVTCPAWNLESACASSLVALETASALVHGGVHRRVLCVTSCTYSRISPPHDTLSWGNGDGAAAFLVERCETPHGLVAFHSMSTNVTCGAIYSVFTEDRVEMRTTEEAGRLLRDTAEPFLRECVDGALAKAELAIEDIDVFVCNTPTAWYTAFCADALGIPMHKTVDAHARVANVGPVLMPANLLQAVRSGQLREGATALLYAVGSVSNATAAIVRFPRVRMLD